jgi:hypothetical protein
LLDSKEFGNPFLFEMINPKIKGNIAERKAKNKFLNCNLKSFRVPLSGADPFFKGDVILGFGPYTFNFESKHYKKISMISIYNLHKRKIPGSQIPGLIFKANYSDTLVAITIDDFCRLAEDVQEYYQLKEKLKRL